MTDDQRSRIVDAADALYYARGFGQVGILRPDGAGNACYRHIMERGACLPGL